MDVCRSPAHEAQASGTFLSSRLHVPPQAGTLACIDSGMHEGVRVAPRMPE